MIVTAALCWFDEPPELLDRCVRSLPVVADRLVALDGAYRRYPGARGASDPAQAAAIDAAAEAVGLDCLVLAPHRPWKGQLQKRTLLMQAAAIGSDWIAVVDADMVLHGDRAIVRTQLGANSMVDTYGADLVTPADPDRPIEEAAATPWHASLATQAIPFVHLFRAYPDIRVERFHWWISAQKRDRRVWLEYGGNEFSEATGERPEPRGHLTGYWIEHLALQRKPACVEARRAWYADRAMVVARTGQEDDVPGVEIA